MNSLLKNRQKTWPDGSVAGVDTKILDILSKKQVPCVTGFGCYGHSCGRYKYRELHESAQVGYAGQK